MSSRQGYAFILIILQMFLPTEVLLYNIRCPETLARNILSRKCTSLGKNIYHCLPVNDIKYDVFKEECKTFEWITPGKYPVLRGEYIDDESCLANTYQPLLYQSDEQHTCLYQKSICSGEGLIEFNNGNTTTDRTCRCDYTKGYKFIVTPKHSCFCIPSEEDCSCFVKSCSPQYKLNADYACVSPTDGNNKEECPIIKGTDLTPKLTTIRYSTTDMIKNTDHWLKSDQIIRLAPLIVLVYAFIVLIIAPICSSGPSNQKAPICSSGPSNQKAPICSSDPSNQKAPICSSDPSNQKAPICSSGPLNQKEPQPTTYPYRLKEDSGSKKILQTGSSARTVKAFSNLAKFFQSITILHVEKDEKVVVDFKLDLQRLLDEIGLRGIEIILYKKKSSTDMDKLLQKGSIVFVYITINAVPAKIEELGFDQKFAEDACNEGKNVYHNVKTVINDTINTASEGLRNDFDYYKKSDDQRKEMLLALLQDIYQSST